MSTRRRRSKSLALSKNISLECDECDYTTVYSTSLKSHVKEFHRREEVQDKKPLDAMNASLRRSISTV